MLTKYWSFYNEISTQVVHNQDMALMENSSANKMATSMIDLLINFYNWDQTQNKIHLVFRLSRPVKDDEFIFADCDESFCYVYIIAYDINGRSEVRKTYKFLMFRPLVKSNIQLNFNDDALNIHLSKQEAERWKFWQATFWFNQPRKRWLRIKVIVNF